MSVTPCKLGLLSDLTTFMGKVILERNRGTWKLAAFFTSFCFFGGFHNFLQVVERKLSLDGFLSFPFLVSTYYKDIDQISPKYFYLHWYTEITTEMIFTTNKKFTPKNNYSPLDQLARPKWKSSQTPGVAPVADVSTNEAPADDIKDTPEQQNHQKTKLHLEINEGAKWLKSKNAV